MPIYDISNTRVDPILFRAAALRAVMAFAAVDWTDARVTLADQDPPPA